MNHENKDAKFTVYSTTGLSDLISSPVFYSVLVLTIFLGLSSAFGFLQNPLKLKAVVQIISKKVSFVDDRGKQAVNQKEYIISNGLQQQGAIIKTFSSIENDRYSIFAKSFSTHQNSRLLNAGVKVVSFDYDITSRQFWSDLNLSKIESALEESQRKSRDSMIIGIPLELKPPAHRDESIYSLSAGSILRI